MAPLTPNEALKLAKQALESAQEIKRSNETFMRSVGPAMVEALTPLLQEIRQAVKTLKVDVAPNVTVEPNIQMPAINVEVPEIHVPRPEVTVNVPPANITVPKIELPPLNVTLPDEMNIRGWINLMGYDRGFLTNPLPVQIRDAKGNPIDFSSLGSTPVMASGGTSGGGGFQYPTIAGFLDSSFAQIQNADGRIRVSMESGSAGLTDTELRAAHLDVQQTSGAVDSVNIVSSITLETRQVSGSIDSVVVTEIFGSTATNVINPDGRIKVELPTGSSGLTDAELRASTLDVKQVSGSIDSVYITGAAASTYAEIMNPDGRVKVELPTGSSGLTDTELRAAHLDVQQVSGSTDSVNVVGPVNQGDAATAIRVVVAGNSDASVVVNSGTLTGITNTITVNQVSGAAFSVNNVGPIAQGDEATALRVVIAGNSISSVFNTGGTVVATLLTRQSNPTAVAADHLPPAADDLGRQLIRPIQVRDLIKTAYVSVTNGTETTLRAAVAGSYLDLIMLVGANNSDAAVSVDIRAVTAGNIIHTLRIPANSSAGWAPAIPWPQDETGNNWTVDGPDETGRTLTFSALFSQEV